MTDPAIARLLGASEVIIRQTSDDDGIIIQALMTHRQVRDVFVDTGDKYPEIMTYKQAAEMVQVAEFTLKG